MGLINYEGMFDVCTSSKTPMYFVSVRRTWERSWLEARALGVGDCNFTHGVTPRSATLHLTAYFPATGSLPRCILPSLFIAPSPRVVCFAFVRWMYECNHMLWNTPSIPHCPSLSLTFSPFSSSLICYSPLRYCREPPSAILHVSWQAEPLPYCQPLSDGPELIRIRRWKRSNVQTINYPR